MAQRIDILGVAIDCVTHTEALKQAVGWMGGVRDSAAHIVTANPEMVMLALEQPALASVLQGADLVVADGTGVVWASRLLHKPLPHRIAGIDLTQSLLAQAAVTSTSVYLLGARPGVAEEAAANLRRQHEGLAIVGTHHGYFAESEEEEIVAAINASGAALVLVALGVPRQEYWITRHRNTLRANVLIGVGGALDVFAGRIRRAPRWTQQLGLEWAYRLAKEPHRIRRLGALPRFVIRVLGEAGRK